MKAKHDVIALISATKVSLIDSAACCGDYNNGTFFISKKN